MQKQLTQGLAQDRCVHSLRGFSYPTVILFRVGKTNKSPADAMRLLQQYEFLNSSLAVAKCAFDNGLSG